LIDDNKRAYGVQYIEDPKKERARSPHPSKSFDTNEGMTDDQSGVYSYQAIHHSFDQE